MRIGESIAPELAWAARESLIDRIALAAQLDKPSGFEANALYGWVRDLKPALGEEVQELLPLFGELFAVKDMRAMALERQHSLRAQKQAAEHAAWHLEDTIAALKAHLNNPHRQAAKHLPAEKLWEKIAAYVNEYASPTTPAERMLGGLSSMVERIEMRYSAQVRALNEEAFRAKSFLKEIDGDGTERVVEIAVAAKEELLQQKLADSLSHMRAASLQLFMDERGEAENLDALA